MRRRAAALVTSVILLAALSPGTGALAGLPDALVLDAGSVADVQVSLPLSAEIADGDVIARLDRSSDSQVSLTAGETTGTRRWCSGCWAWCRSRR